MKINHTRKTKTSKPANHFGFRDNRYTRHTKRTCNRAMLVAFTEGVSAASAKRLGLARLNEALGEIPKASRKAAQQAGIKTINNAIAKKDGLSPLFKWTGGKRREIKRFSSFFPDFVLNNETYTYVEPFVGAGAVFFHLNNLKGKNVINDFDPLLINFYEQFVASDTVFITGLTSIANLTEHDALEKAYYNLRNKDKNGGLDKLTAVEKAIRFFVVNQLAFSGMRRFNSTGEFNVPFGHYKGLNADIINSQPHKDLLSNTELLCGDFEKVMKDNDKDNTFIFLDPPYTREFKEYSPGNSFDEAEHRRLATTIKGMKHAKVMLVIDKSPLTKELYNGLIKETYPLSYGVNIKNRFDTAVEHLVVCNYEVK